ncbi:hypothetical protein ACPXCP_31550 [Streptomyces sp. DT20]|uniref:hypothetical protein n=1 Tax=Streptomyces sp. DT20 TaxID=3416519 RepID=UPI003CF5B072
MDDYDTLMEPGADKLTALLEAIAVAEKMKSELAVELHLLACEARVEGASWSQIARQIGSSRQAAHQRFGGGLTPEHVRLLEEQLVKAQAFAQLQLEFGDEDEFEEALSFVEQQEQLD